MRSLILAICFCLGLAAADYEPIAKIKTNGGVTAAAIEKNLLYIGTDNGEIEVRDISKKYKIVQTIKMLPIKAEFGDELVRPRVFGLDALNGSLAILSNDSEGFKAAHIYRDGNLELIFSYKDKLNIAKLFFADDNRLFFGTLGHDLTLYDLKSRKNVYMVQPYWTLLTDMTISPDRKTAYSSGDSGVIYGTEVATGIKLAEYPNHTNNAVAVAYSGGVLASGGTDHKLVSIEVSGGKKAVFAFESGDAAPIAVSPDGKTIAVANGDFKSILLFDSIDLEMIGSLKGAPSGGVKAILFANESDIYAFFGDNHFAVWRIK